MPTKKKKKKTIKDLDVQGRRVLTRVDFNVPLDDAGHITDARRIEAALPTIRGIVGRGGRLVLMSHLGRPGGKGYEEAYSLAPAADALRDILGHEHSVSFPSRDCIDDDARAAVDGLEDGAIVLLENLRFHHGEKGNDDAFAERLAGLGDIFCNDAFGTAHRAHASMVGVPRAMGDAPAVAGLLLERELEYLAGVLESPTAPFVAVLGGAKVSDKLAAIRNLLPRVDRVLVGGAMAYTFLAVTDRRMGDSRVEQECLDDARSILDEAARQDTRILLPDDHVCAREFSDQGEIRVFEDHIDEGWMGLDIGPRTQQAFAQAVREARTIVWNGPMGVFEKGAFAAGTRAVAEAMAAATDEGAVSVVGGGDSAAAVEQFDLADRFSHVSTGGGASLRLLEGASLPGVEALDDAD